MAVAPFDQLSQVIVVLVIGGDRQAKSGALNTTPLGRWASPCRCLGDNTVHDLVEIFFSREKMGTTNWFQLPPGAAPTKRMATGNGSRRGRFASNA